MCLLLLHYKSERNIVRFTSLYLCLTVLVALITSYSNFDKLINDYALL